MRLSPVLASSLEHATDRQFLLEHRLGRALRERGSQPVPGRPAARPRLRPARRAATSISLSPPTGHASGAPTPAQPRPPPSAPAWPIRSD